MREKGGKFQNEPGGSKVFLRGAEGEQVNVTGAQGLREEELVD